MELTGQSAPMTHAALPTAGPETDEAAKQEFLWHTHQYLGEYARFGDTKAAYAGTVAAALLGALYTAKAHVSVVQTRYVEWPPSTWLTVIAALFLFMSIGLAIWTILPRLRSTQSNGFIYWGSIAAYKNLELLQTSFHSQSARTLNDHLLHHVFDVSSKVCVPKYRTVSLCIWALCIGGIVALAALVLQDVAPKTVPVPTPTTAAPFTTPKKAVTRSEHEKYRVAAGRKSPARKD
jgi:hypothetical protein